MAIDWVKLATEAEQGRRVLVFLNLLELRRQEDREYVEQIKVVAQELAVGWGRAKGQAA